MNPREGWDEIIENHKDEINNDEFLQDWIAAEPYLTSPIDDKSFMFIKYRTK